MVAQHYRDCNLKRSCAAAPWSPSAIAFFLSESMWFFGCGVYVTVIMARVTKPALEFVVRGGVFDALLDVSRKWVKISVFVFSCVEKSELGMTNRMWERHTGHVLLPFCSPFPGDGLFGAVARQLRIHIEVRTYL